MKFSIIIPTYKRPKELVRAVESLLKNNYENWEMIIVNDSPEYDYSIFLDFIKNNIEELDNKIKFYTNKKNMGVNYSRNFALKNMANDSDYFCFLDDDDYFKEDTLSEINKKLSSYSEKVDWLVANRFDIKKNKSITINNTNKEKINYLWDYLIMKKFTGDATHFINTKYKNKKFSKVKNAEEWIFFVQLSKEFYYYDFNATLSCGYEEFGITKNYKDKLEKIKNTFILIKESIKYKIFNLDLVLYFVLRIFAIILK